MNKLTGKQEQVLTFIQHYICQHRHGPFIREIQSACHIASYKSVIDRLNALEHKGFIKREPNKHRAIKVVLPKLAAAVRPAPPAAAVDPAPAPESVSSPASDPQPTILQARTIS